MALTLERAGFIRKQPRAARSIEVIGVFSKMSGRDSIADMVQLNLTDVGFH
jgi:hypothetical protein